ncbi:MAG: hypothetical protein CME64_10765 [Halobacteriovoraceae bacterium]|nr:hypothetical protein [Halobacteriovoraceae bacterium]|tara:strand:- start:83525 stop:83983 length:459 start_codon:yes stop_codon:yes gene_type:complete
MDIYEKILDDHHNIRDTIEELMETDNSQIEKRMRMLKELERLLVSHTNSEEQTLYQVLSETNDKEARAQVRKSRKEHDQANEKLETLKNTSMDSDLFLKNLEDFKEIIEAHFDEEEDEIFDFAKELLSKEDEHLIEEELEDMEEDTWNRPYI